MAIDPKSPVRSVGLESESPIDNEFPAYRALSPLAILSIAMGCLSLLTFTYLGFAVFGLLAIITGLLAQKQVRARPDVLTGISQSNVGIGLGLLFTLMAVTVSGVHDWIYNYEATKFAKVYLQTLKDGDLNDLIFLQASPGGRTGKTPKQVVDEMKGAARERREFDMMNQGVVDLNKRITSGSATVEFVKIEAKTLDGMTYRAAALLKVSGGKVEPGMAETQYALIEIMGDTQIKGYNWMVNKVTFPYTLRQ